MGTFKMVFHRPPEESVQQHAIRKALVSLVEHHKDEFNGYLSDEIAKLESIKCARLIPFGRG